MKLNVNGSELDLPNALSLKDLLSEINTGEKSCAMALNGTFVSRENWDKTFLQSGDCVEIVIPMQGG